VGAVLTAAFVVVVSVTATNVAQDAIQRFGRHQIDVPAGRSVTLTGSAFSIDSGIRTVTVFSVLHPVPAPDSSSPPEAGREFAVADVQVCAGPAGSQTGVTSSLFYLAFSGGERVSTTGAAARLPNLADVQGMAPRQCARGYVTFEIAAGTRPAAVVYEPDALRTYRWTLPSR
jgi:hypothetical protein